jgi:hypothetical protein
VSALIAVLGEELAVPDEKKNGDAAEHSSSAEFTG